MQMLGKELLRETPWTARKFADALDVDVAKLSDSTHAESAIEVLAILAEHIAHLRALGRSDELRAYSDTLHRFQNRHPRLKQLRDLDPALQVGIRIDTLFQDLYASEQVVTPRRALELLTGTASGVETKRKIMEALRDGPLNTTELVAASGLKTRQHLHSALHPLKNAGLVVSTPAPGGISMHEATPLGHHVLKQFDGGDDDRGSLFETVKSEEEGSHDTEIRTLLI